MNREELLKSPEFWTLEIQLELYRIITEYMETNKLNRSQLAEKLGFTKGYITQILNGEFDHRISKMVKLSLSVDRIPRIEFDKIEQVLFDDLSDKLHSPKSERLEIKLQIHPSHQIDSPGDFEYQNINQSAINFTNLSEMVKYAKETIFT